MPLSRLTTFYVLLVGQVLSLIGSRMSAIAIGIWVFSTTGQTTPLLLSSFFLEAPGMLAGSLAGVLVDRWPRKTLLVLADLGQAVASLALLVSFATGLFQLWHLYAVAFVQGSFVALQGPAHSATMTLLVPDAHRDRANAIQELGFPLAGVLATMITGLLYASLGVIGVIAVDLATFTVGAGTALVLAIPQPPRTAEGQAQAGSLLGELRGGLRFLRQRRPLLNLLLGLAVLNFLWNGPLGLDIPYFLAVTGSEVQMGLALGLASLGALAGASLLSVLPAWRPRLRLFVACLVLNGLMALVYGLWRWAPAMMVALFLGILPLPITNALLRSVLQVKTPPDLQGRVFAVESQLALLGSTTSFLVVGPIVDRVLIPAASPPAGGGTAWALIAPVVGTGPAAAMGLVAVMAGLAILATTALIFGQRRVRQLEADLPDYSAEA